MPCQRVQVRREGGRRLGCVWAGFAQREALGWWERNGGLLIDVPAERFALRSRDDSRLVWNEVPGGHVIRGVIDSREGSPLLKVVIRPASGDEQSIFEHPRMPVFALPLFSPPISRAQEAVK